MNNYVAYHVHSMLSLLDSCTSYQDYIIRAKELGQKAICFTEHGNVFKWIAKKMYCESTQYKLIYPDGSIKIVDSEKKIDDGCEVVELPPIKFIFGVEVYLTNDDIKCIRKNRDNYHTILIAKNYDGVKEINTLLRSASKTDHFYYKPRITIPEFLSISDNVIKISACLQSPLNKFKPENKEEEQLLIDLFRKYDYYEVQPHVYSEDQIKYNKMLLDMSKTFDKPLIAGTDTHSLNTYKAECRQILMKAKKNKYTYEENLDLTYQTYDSLCEMFKKQRALPEEEYLKAIDMTNIMADSVEEFELDTSFKYPDIAEDEDAVLVDRIHTMYQDKVRRGIIEDKQVYKDNIKEELRVLRKIGMIGFMLFMSDLCIWCWENGIPVGPCRGSVGGSTIAFITDIIDVDPVKWGCIFSRFANEDRKEIGDIDIDIAPDQRHLVYEHIISNFGEDKTAYILAIGTIAEKGTIDDIGRALFYGWIEENYKSIFDKIEKQKGTRPGAWEVEKHLSSEDKAKSPYSLNKIALIKQEYEQSPALTRNKYPELFYYFDGIINTTVSQSMHPAGIICSPISLYDNYGTFYDESGNQILYVDMDEAHEVSLVKYDILGLKNIQIIREASRLAGIPYPKSHLVNWEDKEVWDHITDSPVGIFQFEGEYANNLLRKYNPRCINDLSLVNAALRPSGDSYRDRLIAHQVNKNPSPIIDEMLADNHGFLVFQEDTLKFLINICGLSGSDADNVRRAIGRKQTERLQAAMPDILEGYCSKSDKPREEAELEAKQFLKIIEDSASYQFGYNHSTGYSMIGYMCGMLRHYYPLEFITAYLNAAANDDDITTGTELARQKGFKIKPARFRHSLSEYFCDKDTLSIYKGVGSIKNMNDQAGEELYELRDNQYESFIDLLYDIKEKTAIDRGKIEILIKLDFFEEFGEVGALLYGANIFNAWYGRKTVPNNEENIPLFIVEKYAGKHTENGIVCLDENKLEKDFPPYFLDDCIKYKYEKDKFGQKTKVANGHSVKKIVNKLGKAEVFKYASKTSVGSYSELDMRSIIKEWFEHTKGESRPCTIKERIDFQQEYMGYVDITVPAADLREIIVMDLDKKYSPRFTAYCLKNGQTCQMKVYKNHNRKAISWYSDKPFSDGDILYMKKCKEEPRKKWDGKHYVPIPNEKEWWLYDYDVVHT